MAYTNHGVVVNLVRERIIFVHAVKEIGLAVDDIEKIHKRNAPWSGPPAPNPLLALINPINSIGIRIN